MSEGASEQGMHASARELGGAAPLQAAAASGRQQVAKRTHRCCPQAHRHLWNRATRPQGPRKAGSGAERPAAARLTFTSHMLSSPQMWHGSVPLGRRALSLPAAPPAAQAALAPQTIL